MSEVRFETFAAFFEAATGNPPYRWQEGLAQDRLPELLRAPTGSGKSAGLLGSWLWRRRFADAVVRREIPRTLVFTLPMRTLVEQTTDVARSMLDRLGLVDEVILATLMGGEPADDTWRLHPEKDTIVVCTLDMGLSGALNRAYGTSRFSWPVTFGRLSSDVHWVFDEVQLMGPAAATSRQLQAFRDRLGTTLPTSSTWMSATLDPEILRTVDAAVVPPPVTVDRRLEEGRLVKLLEAPRRFERWVPGRQAKPDKMAHVQARAARIKEVHRAGTRTLVVLNTVAAARQLASEVSKGSNADVVLLHSRFRPAERRLAFDRAVASPGPAGTILIATQVVEAGVDFSSAVLFTEVAPWPSVVQRAGRCNRYAEVPAGADPAEVPTVFWDEPLGSWRPYDDADGAAAVTILDQIGGSVLSTEELADRDVDLPPPTEHLVLRRPDLIRLFDTAPDLEGNDLDISPYLRDREDLDAHLGWRLLGDDLQPLDSHPPARDELCPVPVVELREWLKGRAKVLRLDHLAGGADAPRRRRHQWVRASADLVMPGQVYLADVTLGGYDPSGGWDPKTKGRVVPVETAHEVPLSPVDETMGADPASQVKRWVPLSRHLGDVREELEVLCPVALAGAPADLKESTIWAGRLHDLGKAHPVFQASMHRTVADGEHGPGPGVWAKSGASGPLRHERRHFRHELASALALLDRASAVLPDGVDADLVLYLVAAHHGRVRMSIRSFPGEGFDAELGRRVMGIDDGEELPGGSYDGLEIPTAHADLGVVDLGHERGSWVALATRLRDRPDLGPFRLGHLESMVRIADWRVSARYDEAAN